MGDTEGAEERNFWSCFQTSDPCNNRKGAGKKLREGETGRACGCWKYRASQHRRDSRGPGGRGGRGRPRPCPHWPCRGWTRQGPAPEGGLTHTGPGGATAAAAGGSGSRWPLRSALPCRLADPLPRAPHRLAPTISCCPQLIDPSHSISIDLSPSFSFFSIVDRATSPSPASARTDFPHLC